LPKKLKTSLLSKDYAIEIVKKQKKDFNNARQESLTQFDQPKKSKRNNRKPKGGRNSNSGTNKKKQAIIKFFKLIKPQLKNTQFQTC
jgi:hypothetical protein